MTNLKEFYEEKNIRILEGYSQQVPEQVKFLKDVVNVPGVKNVMEIGFNAGHSAELFLSSNENIKLTSFDIGHHQYVKMGKQFIDKKFPNRHELIIGNSLTMIPKYIRENSTNFDLIFIDGGHHYNIAIKDLLNCKQLAHKKTIVIMDDTINDKELIKFWNDGPNKAWQECKDSKYVNELGTQDYLIGRGQSWGTYNF